MHGPINVKSPNITSKWQMGFNSEFKGLIITLYKSSLFSVVSLDFLPISQFICRSLRLIWVFFAVMCGLHVNFWSSIRPRYFTFFLLVVVFRLFLELDSQFSGSGMLLVLVDI